MRGMFSYLRVPLETYFTARFYLVTMHMFKRGFAMSFFLVFFKSMQHLIMNFNSSLADNTNLQGFFASLVHNILSLQESHESIIFYGLFILNICVISLIFFDYFWFLHSKLRKRITKTTEMKSKFQKTSSRASPTTLAGIITYATQAIHESTATITERSSHRSESFLRTNTTHMLAKLFHVLSVYEYLFFLPSLRFSFQSSERNNVPQTLKFVNFFATILIIGLIESVDYDVRFIADDRLAKRPTKSIGISRLAFEIVSTAALSMDGDYRIVSGLNLAYHFIEALLQSFSLPHHDSRIQIFVVALHSMNALFSFLLLLSQRQSFNVLLIFGMLVPLVVLIGGILVRIRSTAIFTNYMKILHRLEDNALNSSRSAATAGISIRDASKNSKSFCDIDYVMRAMYAVISFQYDDYLNKKESLLLDSIVYLHNLTCTAYPNCFCVRKSQFISDSRESEQFLSECLSSELKQAYFNDHVILMFKALSNSLYSSNNGGNHSGNSPSNPSNSKNMNNNSNSNSAAATTTNMQQPNYGQLTLISFIIQCVKNQAIATSSIIRIKKSRKPKSNWSLRSLQALQFLMDFSETQFTLLEKARVLNGNSISLNGQSKQIHQVQQTFAMQGHHHISSDEKSPSQSNNNHAFQQQLSRFQHEQSQKQFQQNDQQLLQHNTSNRMSQQLHHGQRGNSSESAVCFYEICSFDETYEITLNVFKECLRAKEAFLLILGNDFIDLSILERAASEVRTLRVLLQRLLTCLLQLNHTHSRLLNLVDLFEATFAIDSKLRRIRDRQRKLNGLHAFQTHSNRMHASSGRGMSSISLHTHDSCVVFVSLLKDLGRIIKVSRNFNTIIPILSNKAASHSNIRDMLPAGIAFEHQNILENFGKRAENMKSQSTYQLQIGINESGFAVPYEIRVQMHYIADEEFGAAAWIRRIKTNYEYIQVRIESLANNNSAASTSAKNQFNNLKFSQHAKSHLSVKAQDLIAVTFTAVTAGIYEEIIGGDRIVSLKDLPKINAKKIIPAFKTSYIEAMMHRYLYGINEITTLILVAPDSKSQLNSKALDFINYSNLSDYENILLSQNSIYVVQGRMHASNNEFIHLCTIEVLSIRRVTDPIEKHAVVEDLVATLERIKRETIIPVEHLSKLEKHGSAGTQQQQQQQQQQNYNHSVVDVDESTGTNLVIGSSANGGNSIAPTGNQQVQTLSQFQQQYVQQQQIIQMQRPKRSTIQLEKQDSLVFRGTNNAISANSNAVLVTHDHFTERSQTNKINPKNYNNSNNMNSSNNNNNNYPAPYSSPRLSVDTARQNLISAKPMTTRDGIIGADEQLIMTVAATASATGENMRQFFPQVVGQFTPREEYTSIDTNRQLPTMSMTALSNDAVLQQYPNNVSNQLKALGIGMHTNSNNNGTNIGSAALSPTAQSEHNLLTQNAGNIDQLNLLQVRNSRVHSIEYEFNTLMKSPTTATGTTMTAAAAFNSNYINNNNNNNHQMVKSSQQTITSILQRTKYDSQHSLQTKRQQQMEAQLSVWQTSGRMQSKQLQQQSEQLISINSVEANNQTNRLHSDNRSHRSKMRPQREVAAAAAAASVRSSEASKSQSKEEMLNKIHSQKKIIGLKIINMAGIAAMVGIFLLNLISFFKVNSFVAVQKQQFHYLNWNSNLRVAMSTILSNLYLGYLSYSGYINLDAQTIIELSQIAFTDCLTNLKTYSDLVSEMSSGNSDQVLIFDKILETQYSYINTMITFPASYMGSQKLLYNRSYNTSLAYALVIEKANIDTLRTIPAYFDGPGFGTAEYNFIPLQNRLVEIQQEMIVSYGEELDSIQQYLLRQLYEILIITLLFAVSILPIYKFMQEKRERILKLMSTIPAQSLNDVLASTALFATAILSEISGNADSSSVQQVAQRWGTTQAGKRKKIPRENNQQLNVLATIAAALTVKKKRNISGTSSIQKINLKYLLGGLLFFALLQIYTFSLYYMMKEYLKTSINNQMLMNNMLETSYFIQLETGTNYSSFYAQMVPYILSRAGETYIAYTKDLHEQTSEYLLKVNSYAENLRNVNRYSQSTYEKFVVGIMEGSVCDTLNAYPQYQSPNITVDSGECSSFHGGLFKNGLVNAITQLFRYQAEIVEAILLPSAPEFQKQINVVFSNISILDFNSMISYVSDILTDLVYFFEVITVELFDYILFLHEILFFVQVAATLITLSLGWYSFYNSIEMKLHRTKLLLDVVDAQLLLENSYIQSFFKTNQ